MLQMLRSLTLMVAITTVVWPTRHLVAQPNAVISQELATSLEPVVDLQQGWRNPPQSARVRCWWWWLNGNVTKQAITRDLEAMKDKGIGGANIIDAGASSTNHGHADIPHGPDFGSPEWRELFVHALTEADRLGLELGFNIQSGWNLGGPAVTPAQAAKKLTWSEVAIDGDGKSIDIELPEPKNKANYYHDIRVMAIPVSEKPFARIDNFRQKAYHSYPGGPTAINAEHLLNFAAEKVEAQIISPAEARDVTERVKEGRLRWDAPAGRWLILRLGYTVSGSHVSTSSDNWKGLAIDYLDASTFETYCDEVLTPILENAGPLVGRSLRFLHTDSWELGPINWTPDLPAQFAKLRGYEMTPYMPALAGYTVGSQRDSTRFLNDFRRTLGDLIADGKYLAFSEYAQQRGLGIHPESGGPHPAPVDALKCLGRSDIPMGEFWARSRTHRVSDTQRLFVKQPASAAHIYGKRLVMAEAFTTIGPQWEKDPRDLKPVFDRVACEGLNLVMWHTFGCSPPEAGVPGNAYFAGTHLNPQTTWWDQSDGFLGYLNRCQFLLQQGLPVADVLYFYGENVPSFVRLKSDNPAGLLEGYDYDVTNLEALIERAQAQDGRIVLKDGVSYAALVLPPDGHYGLKALERVAQLADSGVAISGEKPTLPFGLSANPSKSRRFEQLATRLWENGHVSDLPTDQLLTLKGIGPDFEYQAEGEAHLDYIHRRTNDEEIYFVVNRNATPVDALCSFRVSEKKPQLWDPITGHIRSAVSSSSSKRRTEVRLRLPANGSIFVVFRDNLSSNAHDVAVQSLGEIEQSQEISGPWQVKFERDRGGPTESLEFKSLADWTKSKDPRIRFFSGTATYSTEFMWDGRASEKSQVALDLGAVRNMARIHLNDRDLGVVWTPPFRIDISPMLRTGPNQLRVAVVNLWANRLIGDAQLAEHERITKTNIRKFKGDEPLLPSGLLGPVRIVVKQQKKELTTIPSK